MRYIIAGSRELVSGWRDHAFHLFNGVTQLHTVPEEIITGGARGPDGWGTIWGSVLNIPVTVVKPNYDAYESKHFAPLARNRDMAKMGDVLVAFWDGESNGTRHMIKCAVDEGLPVHVFRLGPNGHR